MNEQRWKNAREFIVVGDIVFMKVHEPKNKLAPRFEGPYRVIEVESGNEVKIRHITTNETKIAHLDHLKRLVRSQDLEEQEPQLPPCVQPPSENPDKDLRNEYRKKLRSYSGDKE